MIIIILHFYGIFMSWVCSTSWTWKQMEKPPFLGVLQPLPAPGRLTCLNEILWAALYGMQAATELQFSHENVRIYFKLLLLKSWDYKVFTGYISFLICNSEKLEHRKLRSLKTNESNPCYIDFEAVLWFEKEGEAAPSIFHTCSRQAWFLTLCWLQLVTKRRCRLL